VAGRGYDQFTDAQREAVVAAFPREADFSHGIIDAFYKGMQHRPDSTFGTFNDDVLAFKDPQFRRIDMCSIILASSWNNRTAATGCAPGHHSAGCGHHTS